MSENKFKGTIRQARITPKGNLAIKYVAHNKEGGVVSNTELTGKRDRPVHKDLITAFNVLKSHAAILGELYPKGKRVDAEYIRKRDVMLDTDLINYSITGFTYKGDDDEQSVTLHVEKELSKGGKITFDIPATKIYNDAAYEFSGNLADDLEDAEVEVRRYMEGKYADSNQLTLFVDEEGDLQEEEIG